MDGGDNGKSFTLMAFLVMAVAMVGLSGLFATFAAPLALEREASREVALDAVLAAAGKPDAPQRLEALRDALGDSAKLVFAAQGDVADRVAAARTAMRVQLAAEAAEAATRLRWLIVVITLVAAAFGAVLVGLAGRRNR